MLIEVSYRKSAIITADGSRMSVRQALVQGQACKSLLQDVPTTRNHESAEFMFVLGPLKRRLLVTSGLENAVAVYLRRYHMKQDLRFDCYAFANLSQGIRRHRVKYLRRYWKMHPLQETPIPGSVVFLVNDSEGHFYHAAVYLGMGLYISVWGAGGDIEVATLKDMKRGFETNEVFCATPLPGW